MDQIHQHPLSVHISCITGNVFLAVDGKQTAGVSLYDNVLFAESAKLILCRCLSSVAGYTTAMVGFAIITVYMVAAAGESSLQTRLLCLTP
jgi:uncharacterized membrane protein YhhN